MTPTNLRRIRRHRLNPHANIWQRLGAVWAIDARYAVPGERYARNLGWAGPALDARYGSAPTPNTNDPTIVPWAGTDYLFVPGTTTANRAQIPNGPELAITGDLDVEIEVAAPSWTPSFTSGLLSKADGAAGSESWYLRITPAGHLQLIISVDGTTYLSLPASDHLVTSVGLIPGERVRFRATLDVDNGAGGRTTAYYVKRSAGGWRPIGGATEVGTTSIFAGPADLYIGSAPGIGAPPADWSIYSTTVRNGIDGSAVASITFDPIADSFVCASGQVVSLTRATSPNRKTVAVDHPRWVLGVDDYFEVPASPLVDLVLGRPASLIAVARVHGFLSVTGFLIARDGGGGASSYDLQVFTGRQIGSRISVAGGPSTTDVPASGAMFVAGATSTPSAVTAWLDGAPSVPGVGPTQTSGSPNALRIGGRPPIGSGNFLDCELYGIGIVTDQAIGSEQFRTVLRDFQEGSS